MTAVAQHPIDRCLRDPKLLGAALGDIASWVVWIAVLCAAFALPLDKAGLELFASVAGGRQPPRHRVRELWALCGRRGGKSRIAAAIAIFFALFAKRKVAPGERPTVLVVAASQDQAQIVFQYVLGFLNESPVLRNEIASATKSEVVLRNGAGPCSPVFSTRSHSGAPKTA